MPVNTPGYSAMAPLSAYTDLTDYTNEGFIYVHAGCRGRDHGAPAGVTDLKAAVRFIRWNANLLPGDMYKIFTFGMSGGGAQSALMGATGDSALYDPYLKAIGAVEGYSDAILGSMCWCPITGLDTADASYEWMMGITRSDLTEEEQDISNRLAAAFAENINAIGIKDTAGNVLKLEASENGIFQSGSYYDHLISVIERSLNNFLTDTSFPYDASSSGGGRRGGNFGGGFPGGGRPDGHMPEGMPANMGEVLIGGKSPDGEVNFEAIDNITRNSSSSGLSLNGTYETPREYIDAMNANGEWVTYDTETNTAHITSIADFVKAFKNASKNLGAFDQLNADQGENTLFGFADGNGAHFDTILADILTELGNEYAEAYTKDLAKTDAFGISMENRVNMYTPLYYLLDSSTGFDTSEVAKYWRIRTGIAQGDTALSTEVNLALALENYEGVESVDFETVWGAGHTMAERTGSSTGNFIDWVKACAEK